MSLWSPLRAELAIWRSRGLTLPLWWRDDDAVAPSAALERLERLSREMALPVHLAAIPARAEAALAGAVAAGPFLALVHGWAHANHAPEGAKPSEFGTPRAEAAEEVALGLERLRRLLGAALLPVFVPPWNRMAPELAPALVAAGYRAVSTFGPRKSAEAAPGLAQVNTHLDPVDWHGTRSLADPEALIAGLVRQLSDRRQGRADAAEPFGLLTHHLMQDAAIWTFCAALLAELMEGPVQAAAILPVD